MVVELRGYDHGRGVLELDTIVVAVSRGRMKRKWMAVVVVAMESRLGRKVVTMHVLGRVLWIVCSHERRVSLLLMLLEELLVLVLVLVLVLLLLGGVLGMLSLLMMLGVILMVMMELLLVLVRVGVLGKLRAMVDIVFLVGGGVRLSAIEAWVVVVMILVVYVDGLGRGRGVRGGGR